MAGSGGNKANCIMSYADHLFCGTREFDIPAGTGKVTRKLVQGPAPGTNDLHHIVEVSFLLR